MKVAIIGGGGAGMTAAYLLRHTHHVTVFEKQQILGGNVRTINKNVTGVDIDPAVTVDNGVIEFQRDNFVNFHKLMDKLGVAYLDIRGGSSSMFLANGRHFHAPLVVRENSRNLWERVLAYSRLLPLWPNFQTLRRWQQADQSRFDGGRMGDYLRRDDFGKWEYMLLMYGYSISYSQLGDFPSSLGMNTLLSSGPGTRWTRLVGGVYTYFEKILDQLTGDVRCGVDINGITRNENGVSVQLADGMQQFDKLIFACPPDQILKLLKDATPAEHARFAAWRPNYARTVIHTDLSMYRPYNMRYFSEFDLFEKEGGQDAGYNAYLNRLCGLPDDSSTTPYCLAYNLEDRIDPKKILHKQDHHTPLYTAEAFKTRPEIIATNGENHIYHAGAYLDNGLHEGAISSGLTVSQLLGGETL